jgi:DNA invertase Pin-like site-specific DNA recombinase
MSGRQLKAISDSANRVAAYVRMSTQRQDQSIEQQLDFIAHYAAASECVVVKVYRDEGKSGLSADRRGGLQQLIADIGAGNPGFDQVLVYDVSRWGRFQDVDESAYYEYLCSRSGIRVVYCAEHFANDGSPLAHIIKSIKRTMAAEYSRELSARTFDAQAFLLARGFKPGGIAGYGLRRLSVRADGSVRRMLERGERKSHPTDRVVLAPGPDMEVQTVRRIFHLYTKQKLSYRAIARTLNDAGVAAVSGGDWSETRVRAVLTNEKYCGNLLYNRTTARLGSKRRANDSTLWVRSEAAHAPIVSPEEHMAAQRQHRLRRGLDPEVVLECLRAIYVRRGTLTYRLIDAEAGMPHAALVQKMFGSLERAYTLALAPLTTDPACVRAARAVASRRRVRAAAWACIERSGHRVAATPSTMVLMIDDSISLRIAITGCRPKMSIMGWVIPAQAAGTDFVLCALMDSQWKTILNYALLAVAGFSQKHKWLPMRSLHAAGMILSTELGSLFGLQNDGVEDLSWNTSDLVFGNN